MFDILSRDLNEQPTLAISGKARADEISDFLGNAFGAVAALIERKGLDYGGAPYAKYRPLDGEFSEFEIEAGFPVLGLAEGEGEVLASTLPAGPAVVLTYLGPYDGMRPAYEAIEQWLGDNRAQADGPAWEVYYSDPATEPDPSTWRTDIFQPFRAVQ